MAERAIRAALVDDDDGGGGPTGIFSSSVDGVGDGGFGGMRDDKNTVVGDIYGKALTSYLEVHLRHTLLLEAGTSLRHGRHFPPPPPPYPLNVRLGVAEELSSSPSS